MSEQHLTIKELTEAVGGGITPRMVRHYHQLGLMPPAQRSSSNYRLYSESDVQRLKRIVALKQQGFQLAHVQKILEVNPQEDAAQTLTAQLQQQYRSLVQQLAHLRQTASALESLLGRDRHCQLLQAEALAQLRLFEVETQSGLGELEQLWHGLDASVSNHPEKFQESLQQLLPDLSNRSEIEVDLIAKLVLACGDVSLCHFLRMSPEAIALARQSLSAGCQIVGDISVVVAALDQTRLAHLPGCQVETLINDPHITNADEAEQAFWQHHSFSERLQQVADQSILVIGYSPSVLMSACVAIEQGQIQPALVIGMPIGFSHAPAAKRQLMRSGIPYITIEGTLGGGLLAAVALNALVASLLEKPDCHCYLNFASDRFTN
ncbi:MAG: precorrin-8X methylmutase [Chroococcidiopsidaceae cyanobacterium CP_BM_ER_R8_30]|nr:precorrin-8X methylmutase [Chroococcidiopsidaceae cyanobacterium CP_BM_ER_R8_30]